MLLFIVPMLAFVINLFLQALPHSGMMQPFFLLLLQRNAGFGLPISRHELSEHYPDHADPILTSTWTFPLACMT